MYPVLAKDLRVGLSELPVMNQVWSGLGMGRIKVCGEEEVAK